LISMTGDAVVRPYAYDAVGNLIKKENNVQNQTYGGAQSCVGCAPNRGPHALATSNGVTYNYDANGNLISTSNGTNITWNSENMPTQVVQGGITTYQKFFLGETLWKKVEPNVTTYYLPSMRVENGQFRKFFGGFAERSPDGTLKFYHGDHLGSASLVTDSAGNVIDRQAYMPYGEDRFVSGTFAPKYQFNFKERESTGFYDYSARLYNPATGRWLSADSSASDGLNRYMYVSNNPLRYTDPTGHQQEIDNGCNGVCQVPELKQPDFLKLFPSYVDVRAAWMKQALVNIRANEQRRQAKHDASRPLRQQRALERAASEAAAAEAQARIPARYQPRYDFAAAAVAGMLKFSDPLDSSAENLKILGAARESHWKTAWVTGFATDLALGMGITKLAGAGTVSQFLREFTADNGANASSVFSQEVKQKIAEKAGEKLEEKAAKGIGGKRPEQ